MKIENVRVYDLVESIIASGFPMKAAVSVTDFDKSLMQLVSDTSNHKLQENKDYKRACMLAKNPAGSGHNNLLSGIVVSANVTATNVWWLQMERYHFVQIVSMQSKMHRLREMIKNETADCHEKTNQAFIDILSEFDYDDEELVYSCPMGLELTARIVTNYLQLKTIYNQRKNHKLQEWHTFCDFISKLPLAKEFILAEKED